MSELDLGTIAKDTTCDDEESREELVKLLQLILYNTNFFRHDVHLLLLLERTIEGRDKNKKSWLLQTKEFIS